MENSLDSSIEYRPSESEVIENNEFSVDPNILAQEALFDSNVYFHMNENGEDEGTSSFYTNHPRRSTDNDDETLADCAIVEERHLEQSMSHINQNVSHMSHNMPHNMSQNMPHVPQNYNSGTQNYNSGTLNYPSNNQGRTVTQNNHGSTVTQNHGSNVTQNNHGLSVTQTNHGLTPSQNPSPNNHRTHHSTSQGTNNHTAHNRVPQMPNETCYEQPPIWIPDVEAPKCMSCKANFTVVKRRHHCRNCGKIFCARCSSNSVPLPKFGHIKPVRVCNKCFLYHLSPFTM